METQPSIPMDPQQLNALKRIDDALKRILVKKSLEEPNAPTPPIVTLVIKEL